MDFSLSALNCTQEDLNPPPSGDITRIPLFYLFPNCYLQSENNQCLKIGKVAEIAVIDQSKEAMLRQLPTIHLVCEKCGNTESEIWNVEVADETIHSTITFFRCTKCKTTKRESG
jgi:DNA-directed RNA polymerase subunit M/transcription elongation factor TFIIS